MAASFTLVSLLGLAAAQQLATNPGGFVPAGVKAPNTAGLRNATISPSRGGLAVCVSGMVTINATSTKNLKFNFETPQNQTGLTDVFTQFITAGSPFMKNIMAGTQTVSGSYDIGATLCTPADNSNPAGVQLLTHGIGFDRHYWDFAPGYSYVDAAIQAGYATLSYDRLGVGASDQPDPLNAIQAALQVEIAAELGRQLRSGVFGGCSFATVVGVGHSFGSIISQSITALYPDVLDAAVLTGFSMNNTGIPPFVSGLNFQIASQNQPYRFTALPPGFFVSATPISAQIGFFRVPGFDPNVLFMADAGKGTTTYGEWFSITSVTQPAQNFTGSVIVVNGDADLPFCLGNCTYPTDLGAAAVTMLYPNLDQNMTSSIVVPQTGHGVSLHYGAAEAYLSVQGFLKAQNL